MIKVEIKYLGNKIDIQFPISENELCEKLAAIHAPDGTDEPNDVYVTKVYWPEEFSMLESCPVNLDELNYLAKRMESFDALEMDQFLIAVSKAENPTAKDIINLTYNLDHFTLVKDVGSMGKIGRAYVLNTEGSVPANDEDNPKYAVIGKDLVNRGLTQLTEKGLLIYDPSDELHEVYDGHTFPGYYYRGDFLVSAEIKYNGQSELLLLPDEELTIRKAITRLGAPSAEDCTVSIDVNNTGSEAWADRIQSIISKEGIYEANAMLKAMNIGENDWDKLSAVIELAGAESARNIIILAEHLRDFGFIPNVKYGVDVAHYLVDNIDEYAINMEMEEFFDFDNFGEYFIEEYDGEFVAGGFAYCEGGMRLDELLECLEDENEEISMGGM